MGRVLAALIVVLALTGCTVTATPAPGLSDAEREILQQQQRDNYWEYSGLADDQRPAAASVPVVTADEWPVLFVACMNDAGFDNYEASGSGYSVSMVESTQPEVEMLASYVCSTSYWVDAGWYNTAQINYLYDYYEQTLVPCLAVHDAEIWGAPTREKFLTDGGGWHPYFNFKEADQERIYADKRLPTECPAMPPGMDNPGYSFLWDQLQG